MKMVVLVTGASGFLGGRICDALVRQGYHVKAFVRKTSDLSGLPPPSPGGATGGILELAYGDVTDYPSLLEAFSGCHVIFHAAALVEPWLPDPSRFSTVNVGGLKNVLRAYREIKGVEKIIYTSSFFALGSTDGRIADETQMHPTNYFCTEYEKSKVIADKIALEAAADGIPIVPVYPGVIYGPGKVTTGNVVAHLLVERFSGRLPGYVGLEKGFSFCHVNDVAQGHVAAMIKGRVGERYLLTGENASFKDVFDLAASITHTAKPWFGLPLWIVEAYGWLSVLFSRLTGKLPLISPPAFGVLTLACQRICYEFWGPGTSLRKSLLRVLVFKLQHFDIQYVEWLDARVFSDVINTVRVLRHQWAYTCEKAKAELDYNPRSLEEGLTEMVPWLKSLGLIKY